MTRRLAILAVFGLIIFGAMLSSWLHLAAWLSPWMPPGWQQLSYVAALSIDGMIIAPMMARQLVGRAVPGLALPAAQALGVAASIYVNWRWGAGAIRGATAADIAVGAGLLPVFAMVMEWGMRATLATHGDAQPAAVVVAKRTRAKTGAVQSVPVMPVIPVNGGSAAELAARAGVSLRTAYRMRAAGRAA